MLDTVHVRTYRFGLRCDAFYHFRYGLVDTAFQVHRISPGRYVLQSYANDGLRQNGSSCRTVAGFVVRLRSDFLHKLRPHVLVRTSELYFFRHRYTVFGDLRSTEFLFEDHIATFRT